MAKFPDLTGDGQVTQADVLKGRGVYKKGGSVKGDHGHKPMAKMSHGGHYCWGGKVMKKAEGGGVLRGLALDSKPTRPSRPLGMSSGAPMSPPPRTPFRDIAIPSGPGRLRPPMPVMPRPTTPTPPPKPALTGSSMRMNKAQGGKVMAGTDSDGRTHRKIEKGMGYSDGGMAKGGPTAREMLKYYKDKDRKDTSWIEKDGKADPYDTANLHFKNFQDKIKEEFPKNYEDEPSVRTRAYSEKAKDFGKEGQAGMKRGGMAKGGNWIQSAIKKPGALKKSLGVPMDKPIPAKKLEKASKAPGKMGQRARLAMTLKGMK